MSVLEGYASKAGLAADRLKLVESRIVNQQGLGVNPLLREARDIIDDLLRSFETPVEVDNL